ncbi:hypothetical protein DYB32_009310 [Aphanomyces invadans]|uniref:Uncharacterized protein n=1 Tax=Aphanomyces invadans TaxID=157072 RepID=A0A418AIY9_9STRA|nr:hypothetical protein DYB32_009310 [Aphanomyces invadans]
MSEAIVSTPAGPAATGIVKANSISTITDTFGKQSTGTSNDATKDLELSTGSPLPTSIYVKMGDTIQLAAKAQEGELGRVRFIVDPAIKQTLLVVPPIQEGTSSELATFTIELSYNQLFTLQIAGANGAAVKSLNSNPPGMSDGIGLQEPGIKGEMTFMFKGKDTSKIQFNDANLVLTCHDANRTRKNFNNVATIIKKSKTAGHGGFLTTAKKGPAITFTVTRPNVVPAVRVQHYCFSDGESDMIRSEAASVVVSEVTKPTDSFTAAVMSPLPPTPTESFSGLDGSNAVTLPYVPPTLPPPSPSKRASLAVPSTLVKVATSALVETTSSPTHPVAHTTGKQSSNDDGDVVVVRNTSPAVQDSKSVDASPGGPQTEHKAKAAPVNTWKLSSTQANDDDDTIARDDLEHLQDVEADNERLRSRVLQVEGKLERLDAAFRDQRQELEDALDTRVALESRWREAAETLQKAVDETTRTYQGKLKTMEEDLEKRAAKIVRLEEAIEETKAVADHRESKLEHKISQVEAMNVALEKQTATGNASWEAERARLLNELANAEKKDRMTKFLKRKTSMNKAQAELEATIQALEGQIQLQQAESAHQAQTLQALLHVRHARGSHQRKNPDASAGVTNESNHQEHVKRERHRFYLDEVVGRCDYSCINSGDVHAQQNKALLKREKKMQGDMTELSMALRDMADEKRVLEDKVKSLLGTYRHDILHNPHTWRIVYPSRMKLLAQFCDEENKLTSSLNAHVSSAYNHRK